MTYVSKGCKELKRTYPFTKGLTKDTETQEGRIMNLRYTKVTTVYKKEKKGL